ncbi:hypothetical protein [Streptomyces sp. NPDC088727]|uniref:hypothetical protein n=1 Tax=Streptomyces sp. NPDC088727 TaxID=3365875 RepID=UPI0037F198EB
MAKRKQVERPWPDNVWYAQGTASTASGSRSAQEQLDHLAATGVIQHHRAFDPRDHNPKSINWWGYDASWCMKDGACVRARMTLAPDCLQAVVLGRSKQDIDADTIGRTQLRWTVTAVADRPWQDEWISPLLIFFTENTELFDMGTGDMSLKHVTVFDEPPVLAGVEYLLESLSLATWCTVVITHDRKADDSNSEVSVQDLVHGHTFGRMIEIRARGDEDQLFNAALEHYRVSLPWGGSVILPSTPRKALWATADYSVSAPPGGNFADLIQETAQRVTRYNAIPTHYPDDAMWSVSEMNETWSLPDPVHEPSSVLKELAQAKNRVSDLTKELQASRKLAKELQEQRQAALDQASAARGKFLSHPLAVEAQEAREQADRAFSSEEAMMVLTENLSSEVAWLRRQLAMVPGRTYAEPAPQKQKGPESWEELLELATLLFARVQIGDIKDPLTKLANHKNERTWLRRTWDALEALDAYAEAKKEHGADLLPHFNAYLNWPEATVVVPSTMYCPSEVLIDRSASEKKRRARLFHAEGLGEVFMGAHFRVGGVKPPAPRMHVYDDTSGPTGMVHVGYIGPHLPTGAMH